MNKRLDSKGITLIALVVTIIVLLILAGVTLGLVFSSDGIFIKANDAATKYNQAKEDESNFLNKIIGNYGDVEKPGNDKEEGILTLSETSGTITYPDTGTFEITENTSNGNLSVSSSDESIASASISGNTVTIISKSIAESEKEVVITVKSEETEKYKEQTAIYIATIKQGGIIIEAVPNVRQYDGTAFDALSSVTVTPIDAVIEYSLNDGEYQSEIPKIAEVGQYTITIKASKDGYVTKEETITVTVSKQSSTTGNLTLSETSGTITYPSNGSFTITNNKSEGTLSVNSSNTNVATASISNNKVTITPKAITSSGQTATITVTSEETEKYKEQTAIYTVTVNQGTISISATACSGEYDGSSHSAIYNIVVNPSDATKTYSLNNGTYSSTIPTISAQGTYTVKIRAEKAGYSTQIQTYTAKIREPALPAAGTTPPSGGWSVDVAKKLVARDGLKAHLGEQVAYNPTGGGTWRIFYYDNENVGSGNGYFGKLNTLYLKRDFVSNDTKLVGWTGYIPSDGGAIMRKMNPKWGTLNKGTSMDTENEHCVAWLCDPECWTKYRVTGVADYAIGSPSVEMYSKAFNVYKDNNPNSTTLINKTEYNLYKGYCVGVKGDYTISGDGSWYTEYNSIEAGPNNIFMTAGYNWWWLASPSFHRTSGINIVFVNGSDARVYMSGPDGTYGVCPIAAISQ